MGSGAQLAALLQITSFPSLGMVEHTGIARGEQLHHSLWGKTLIPLEMNCVLEINYLLQVCCLRTCIACI